MTTRNVSLFCTQGEDFSYVIHLLDQSGNPLDVAYVSNSSSQIRKSYISANSVEMNVSVTTGTLNLSLTAGQTAGMDPGRYIYDVKFVSSSNVVSKPVGGIITIAPGASQ